MGRYAELGLDDGFGLLIGFKGWTAWIADDVAETTYAYGGLLVYKAFTADAPRNLERLRGARCYEPSRPVVISLRSLVRGAGLGLRNIQNENIDQSNQFWWQRLLDARF